MSDRARRRPTFDEYGEYFGKYIGLVPESDILPALDIQAALVERWPARVAPEKEAVGYAPGKWSPRQVVGHLPPQTCRIVPVSHLLIADSARTVERCHHRVQLEL